MAATDSLLGIAVLGFTIGVLAGAFGLVKKATGGAFGIFGK